MGRNTIIKPNNKISKGNTIKLIVNGKKKLTIKKFRVIDKIKTIEMVILLKNALISPFFLAIKEIFNIIKPYKYKILRIKKEIKFTKNQTLNSIYI